MYNFFVDHIVHYVKNPKEAKQFMEHQNFHVVEGGHHKQWGTYNTLCYFGLTYLEFIGVYDEAIAAQAANVPYSLLAHFANNRYAEGHITMALRTTQIEDVKVHLQNNGFETYGPNEYTRHRPDGSVLKWKLLYAGKPDDKVRFPFFIQWDEPDDVRLKTLKDTGGFSNENGELTKVFYGVEHAYETAIAWQQILGGTVRDTALHLNGVAIEFKERDECSPGPIGVEIESLQSPKQFTMNFGFYRTT